MNSIYLSFYPYVKRFREPLNLQKNGSLNYFLDQLKCSFSIHISVIMDFIKNSAPQTQLLIITTLFQDRFPGLSQQAALAATKILLYFNTVKEFFTTNCELQSVTGYGKTVLKEITQELEDYIVILKRRGRFFNGYEYNNNTLVLQLNLLDLAELVDENPQNFFANFINNQTVQTDQKTKFRIAEFKGMYNEKQTLEIEEFAVKHTQETSKFFDLLKNGDQVTFSFNARNLGDSCAPHSLFKNLSVCRHLESFIARFGDIETTEHRGEESKHVWIRKIDNYEHKLTMPCYRLSDLTEEELKFFESLELNEYILFEAEVESLDEKDTRKIRNLKKPTNIRSAYQ